MNHKKQVIKYILADYITAVLAWFLFYVFRRIEIDLVAIRDIQNVCTHVQCTCYYVTCPFLLDSFIRSIRIL